MVSSSEPEQPPSPEEETSAPSDVGPPNALVPAPTPAQYTKEDLQRITKLCMDLFLQGQGSRPEPAGH